MNTAGLVCNNRWRARLPAILAGLLQSVQREAKVMRLASLPVILTRMPSAMHSRSSLDLQLEGIIDGNGAGVAIAVGIVGTLACHALCDNRHFVLSVFV